MMPMSWQRVVPADFDDDDAGALADLAALVTEADTQINHRYHGTAQVDHATDEGRHHRDLGELAVLDDLLDVKDAHRVHLAAEQEGQVLPDLRQVGDCCQGLGA